MSRSVKNPKRPMNARADANTTDARATTTDDPTKKRKRPRSNSPDRPTKKPALDKAPVTDVVVKVPIKPTPAEPLDITKRDIRVVEPMEIVPADPDSKGTLRSLLMETGQLEELLKGDGGWPAIAEKMSSVLKEGETDIAVLGTLYYTPEKKGINANKANTDLLGDDTWDDTVKFLEAFMGANGQSDYIKKQDWFTEDSEYAIAIDVNYYPNRNIINDSPSFHKDSAGDNIFVNLIFDNKDAIEATEWFADAAEPSRRRASWQGKLLPESHLKALALTRDVLQQEADENSMVEGGITEGRYAYVSWVDDLIWHATPANPRNEYKVDDAQRDYPNFNFAYKYDRPPWALAFREIGASPKSHLYKWLKSNGIDANGIDDKLAREIVQKLLYKGDAGRLLLKEDLKTQGYKDLVKSQRIYARRGVEILGTIAESKDETNLSKWLGGRSAQDIDQPLAKEAWRALYQGRDGEARFIQDALIRAGAQKEWRVTGWGPSEAVTQVKYLPGSSSIRETPIGLSTRRRRASLEQEAILKVRKANKDVPRSFIRTWVRIVRKDSAEAEKVVLV
jgi:hypothetical protein